MSEPRLCMAEGQRRSWQELALRLQQIGNHSGLCLVTATAIVVDGQLVGWTKPREIRFEPTADGEQIWKALYGETNIE